MSFVLLAMGGLGEAAAVRNDKCPNNTCSDINGAFFCSGWNGVGYPGVDDFDLNGKHISSA